MFKPVTYALTLLLLAGCSSQPLSYQATEANREAMLVDSGNHRQLVAFYEGQLKQKQDDAVRVKLAQVHLELHDAESALFVVSDVKQLAGNVDALKIQAKASYQLGELSGALHAAKQALALQPDDGELHSLLGVLYTENGQLDAALAAFNQARRYFYDEVKVKNNLASVYLLKGDYPKALTLLNPLYSRFPEDITIRANLIIAQVKSGHSAQAAAILQQHYDLDAVEPVLKAIEARGTQALPTGSAHTQAAGPHHEE